MTPRTTFNALCAALYAITALTLAMMPAPLAAQTDARHHDDIFAITHPVPLDASDEARAQVGELIYRGGLRIDPEAPDSDEVIGGISGLEWHDGALWAVSDDGRWLRMVPGESNGELRDIIGLTIGPLLDERGKRLKGKDDADAEALTRTQEGDWLVSFERNHRILRYRNFDSAAQVFEYENFGPQLDRGDNRGFETLASAPGFYLQCLEKGGAQFPNCYKIGGRISGFPIPAPPELAEYGGAPTDAACAGDGTCYILMRSYAKAPGARAAIIELSPDNETRTLAVFDAPIIRDNFEGLALREQFGKRYLYLVSDDNFNNCAKPADGCQENLVLKFEIKTKEPPVPQISDATRPDPQYETIDVVLETQMGDITVALEIERAPITAANFLRYVEEGRFDGTVFYRAMRLPREPRPNGLLQGGTQFDPERILPGIEHEPTTITGLSHTNGALSMAMGEPGSANGDFSIMLQDQTGLDARPDAEDPVWRNGYAVFGYVTEGMDVVAAIHASEIDPDKGEGWMKGQMLAQPVEIIRARRAQK